MAHLTGVLAAILVAMAKVCVKLNFHFSATTPETAKDVQACPLRDAEDEKKYIHDFHVNWPAQSASERRLIVTEGSAGCAPRQRIAHVPKGTTEMSHLCQAEQGHVMTRADVDAGARSAHEVNAAASSRDPSEHFRKRVREALSATLEDALPLLPGGASYASDEQREGVHLQQGDSRQQQPDVVSPPKSKACRRHFLRRVSAGIVGSNLAGSSR